MPGSKNVITPDEAVVIVVRKLGSSLSKKMNGFRIQIKSEGEKMSLAGWIYPDDRDMMPGWKK